MPSWRRKKDFKKSQSEAENEKARIESKQVKDEAIKRIEAMEIKLAAAEKAVEEERAAAAKAAAEAAERKKNSSIWGKLLKTVKVAFKAPSPDVYDSDYE